VIPHIESLSDARSSFPWTPLLLSFVLTVGFVLRLTNLTILPPFIDESSCLDAAVDYSPHPIWERLFFGKYLGYLLQRPIMELCADPIWGARALSGLLGIAGAIFATSAVYRGAGRRAAVYCAVLLALNPQLVFHDRLALHESFVFFFLAASCWCATRSSAERFSLWMVLAGAAGAAACATKLYSAPLLLVLAPLLRDPVSEWKLLVRRDIPPFLLGLVLASLIILLSAYEFTYQPRPPLSDLLSLPKSIISSSTHAVPPLLERIGNASTSLFAYSSFTVWSLQLFVLVPLRRRPTRAQLCLLVAAIAFALYTLSFGAFTATRYFNSLWLPLAFAVSLRIPELRAELSGTSWVARWLFRLPPLLLGIVAIQFFARDRHLLTDPLRFPLPHGDTYQYISGWPSGRGLRETEAYLRARSMRSERPLLIIVLMGYRHGNMSLPLLMRDVSRVQFLSAWDGDQALLHELTSLSRVNTLLILVEPLGTPVSLPRVEAAGLVVSEVFSAPAFADSPGYRILEVDSP
jgi:4-amino-4-deoxy-L-arabinose transferase-like glycosyltransferase